jgi:hypothetical protein
MNIFPLFYLFSKPVFEVIFLPTFITIKKVQNCYIFLSVSVPKGVVASYICKNSNYR